MYRTGGNVKYRIDEQKIEEVAQRLIDDIEADFKPIQFFGIVGDGVVDDTDAIRDYIQHVKNGGGGKVYLPSGTYKITGTLEIPSNTTLEGDGVSTVFELGDGFELTTRHFREHYLSYPYIVNEEFAENVVFKDFKVIGNRNNGVDERHHGVALIDCTHAVISNVHTDYINYFPQLANSYGTMAYGIGIVRAKHVKILGGTLNHGGYENIGFEFAEDVTVDGLTSLDAWRTSFQIHQGNKRIRVSNCTIVQSDTPAHAAFTFHGRGAGGENDDLILHNNIIKLLSPGGYDPYMGTVQMIGPHRKVKFSDNTIIGTKNGIYNFHEADFIMATGNVIKCQTGVGLHMNGGGLISNNYIDNADGDNYIATIGFDIVGSNNVGFTI